MKKSKKKKQNALYELCCFVIIVIVMYLYSHKSLITHSLIMNIIIISIVFLVACVLFQFLLIKRKKEKYLKSNIFQIDHMSGIEFEEFLKAHFEKQGYKVNTTPASGDYGVDLICKNKTDQMVIQAKRYKSKVGISAVQQIIGGMHYYTCKKGMVITNSFFTNNAWELAKKSNVILWDRNMLIKTFDIKEEKR